MEAIGEVFEPGLTRVARHCPVDVSHNRLWFERDWEVIARKISHQSEVVEDETSHRDREEAQDRSTRMRPS